MDYQYLLFFFFLRYENIVKIMKPESHEVKLSEHCTHLDVLVNQVPKGDSVTGTYTLYFFEIETKNKIR